MHDTDGCARWGGGSGLHPEAPMRDSSHTGRAIPGRQHEWQATGRPEAAGGKDPVMRTGPTRTRDRGEGDPIASRGRLQAFAEQGGGTPERGDPARPGKNSRMGSGNELIIKEGRAGAGGPGAASRPEG